jgi:hypothetical protein
MYNKYCVINRKAVRVIEQMIEVYYYLPQEKSGICVECGMKLSDWYDKQLVVDGEERMCLSALLNPKDDKDRYGCKELSCVKLEVYPRYCYIADKWLYHMGLGDPEMMMMYESSIIPVENYKFGSYRFPECLVTNTVVGGHISLLNSRIDSPVIFEDSETLYLNNLVESFRVRHNDFYDAALYGLFKRLSEIRIFDERRSEKEGIVLFIDRRTGESYTVRMPDINSY